MYTKVVPPEYITFDDVFFADIAAYYFGDIESLTSGTYKSGTLVGADNVEVSSDAIFANNNAITAHKSSTNKNIASVSAHTVSYRLYFTISGSTGNDIWDADTVANTSSKVLNIQALTGTNTSYSSVKSVTKADWANEKASNTVIQFDSTENKYYADFTAANNCRYIKISVYADSGVSIGWSLNIQSGTVYSPVGIVSKQCSAVTSLGTQFGYNFQITSLAGLSYFDGVTTITNSYAFRNTSITEVTLPANVTATTSGIFVNSNNLVVGIIPEGIITIGNQCFYGCPNLNVASFPSTVTSIGNQQFSGTALKCLIVKATTPPTITSTTFQSLPSAAYIYVPDASLSTYTSSEYWSSLASGKILGKSNLPSQYSQYWE